MQTIADAGKASLYTAPVANASIAGGTLRSTLYAEDFRQVARDAALVAPIKPLTDKPSAQPGAQPGS